MRGQEAFGNLNILISHGTPPVKVHGCPTLGIPNMQSRDAVSGNSGRSYASCVQRASTCISDYPIFVSPLDGTSRVAPDVV